MFEPFTAASANDRWRPHIMCVPKYRFASPRHAKAQGWLTLDDLSHLDNVTFSKALMKPTSPSRDVTFKMPDYEHVHAELAKPHVTLKLL